MNCPNCVFSLDPNFTGPCPRCGQPITGSAPANAGGYGLGMDPFSQSPTILSSGPVPPRASGPNENYGSPYSNQSTPNDNYGFSYPSQNPPPSAPSGWPSAPPPALNAWQGPPPGVSNAWPGQPSGYNSPGYPPPYSPAGFPPQPPAPMPQRKGRTGLIIGTLVILVVLLVSGLGIALFALNGRNRQGQTGAGATATASLATPSPTPAPT